MSETKHDLRCRVGRHHHVPVADDNPEKRGGMHLECTRCGHVKDFNSHDPMSMGGVTRLGGVAGF